MKHPRLHPSWIDSHAHGIVKALQKKDFETYLVGGCVRDLLLGIHPKDFDIATTAQPEDIRKIIYKAYVIGKRFRLVLVKRDDQQYEVATFRKNIEDHEGADEDLPDGDNLFGSPKEDALRRDFTINGLFYDSVSDQLIDHPGGLDDLESGLIRMIGEPNQRLIEDPIRILRALRLAHKIQFSIEAELREAMLKNAESLLGSALPRRREEILKLLKLKNPSMAFLEAYDLNILKFISPQLHTALSDNEQSHLILSGLAQPESIWTDEDNPMELFGQLVYLFLDAKGMLDKEKSLRAKEILENQDVLSLMKDELGMFKYEQALVAKAVQMQATLRKRVDFERKGQRRQMAVLKNEAFPLALKMAIRGQRLTATDLNFWLTNYWVAEPEIEKSKAEESQKRRASNRKRRRKPRGRVSDQNKSAKG